MAMAPLSYAQTFLESPTPGSFESGVSLIRGWVCEANSVEVVIDQGTDQERRLATAYPTRRQDTEGVCGDSDNGFGVTINWNNLGDGVHNLRALADNVEFANVDFVVTTLNGDFRTGLNGQFSLPDFPNVGNSTTVRWSEPHQNFVITSNLNVPANPNPPSVPRTFLESPTQGSFESGVGLIRGWVCEANAVEVVIDAGTPTEKRLATAYPTRRQDTEGVCGDSDNGFGVTINWNNIGDGVHNLSAQADGVEFANINFAVTTLGGDFLTGLRGDYPLSDFPAAGQRTTLRWSEPHQNFIISTSTATGDKVALISALQDVLNPLGSIAADPANFASLFGVTVGRAGNGQVVSLNSLEWADLDSGLWSELVLASDGLPEQYQDSNGITARFSNFTASSVDVSFVDDGGSVIAGPFVMNIDFARLAPLQALATSLGSAQFSAAKTLSLRADSVVNVAAATLNALTVETVWAGGVALNEMLCGVAGVGVSDVVALSGCAAPVVNGFSALADAPGGALDSRVQQAFKFSRAVITNAPCDAAADITGCLEEAAAALRQIEPEEGGTTSTPPAVPNGVQASDGLYGDKVSIVWNTVADASYYEVYRDGSLIGQPESPSFDDFNVTPGIQYEYRIKACNADGCSDLSVADTGYAQQQEAQQFTVTAVASAGGRVEPPSQTVNAGQTASLNVVADSGYFILSVTGCGGTLNGATYQTGAINANCTVNANFAPVEVILRQLTLQIAGTGGGTVSAQAGGTGAFAQPATATLDVPAGAVISLTATPSEGSTFEGWSPSPCSDTFEMPDQDLTCTAIFTLQDPGTPTQYSLTLNTAGTGVGVVSGEGNYAEGETVTLLVDQNSSSTFDGWTPAPCAPTFPMPAQNLTCTATFTLKSYTVTGEASTGGSITPPSQTVDHGAMATFLVTPDSGYQIDVVSGCGGTLSGATYTTGPITAACTVNASFSVIVGSGPSSVVASDGTFTDQVEILWSAATSATGYRVFRDGNQVAQTAGTFAFDTKMTPGQKHNYTVAACFSAGCGQESQSDTGYARLATPANASTSCNFSTPGPDGVPVFSWNAVPGAVTYYELYDSTSSSSIGSQWGTTGPAVTSVDAQPTRWYRVRACNESTGCGDFSSPVQAPFCIG
ncbi:MAG: hypothetical protein H6970_13885 [Gammaproteobacteria bacterium]|nr:hypothetical protein [Gammaproteobacteria bacterium]MCP5426139.1 hypothetical protein [Gammaproteobacteria bacterium]